MNLDVTFNERDRTFDIGFDNDATPFASEFGEVQVVNTATDHARLHNRDLADQHPVSAITGLEDALEEKQPKGSYLTKETDPTVPSWAKQPKKPAYTASEVGADASGSASAALKSAKEYTDKQIAAIPTPDVSGQISTHNTATGAHNDIRLLISGLTERLNALANSDDTTLDQMAEVVAYIKDNRELIEQVTTGKVSVSDIVNDLTTNVSDKPLSAAQGVALKTLLDKKAVSGHNHSGQEITTGTISSARLPTIPVTKGGTGAIDVETARVNLGVPSVEEMNAAFNSFKTEDWTFTLEDGSTVTKAVYVG